MRNALVMTMLLAMIVASGCRTATRAIDESRVDLDLPQGGNRGYLVGAPPAWEGPKKTIRKMVEMEIETPPIWKSAQPPQLSLDDAASAPIEEPSSPTLTESRPPYTK